MGAQARLFTTKKSEELRSVEVLVATMVAIPTFGRAVMEPLPIPGGSRSRLSASTETIVDDGTEADACITVEFGPRRLVVMLEAKTGDKIIERHQWDRYVDIVQRRPDHALLTLSNRIARPGREHPDAPTDPARYDGSIRARLAHVSWSDVTTLATRHARDYDPRALEHLVLDDLSAFLKRANSGAKKLEKMGPGWNEVVRQPQGHNAITDLQAERTARRWYELLGFSALAATGETHLDVRVHGSRASFPKTLERASRNVQRHRMLHGRYDVDGDRVDVTLGLYSAEVTFAAHLPLVGNGTRARIERFLEATSGLPDNATAEIQEMSRDALLNGPGTQPFSHMPRHGLVRWSETLPRLTDASRTRQGVARLYRRRFEKFLQTGYLRVKERLGGAAQG